jgi:5'-3' exonuclease
MLLIDGDTPCYAAAVVHEDTSESQAIWEANTSIARLLNETNSTQYKLFLTGDTNFRYSIFPEYKGNRLNQPRPKHLKAVKQAVLQEWKGILSDGCEADDLIGIEQTTNYAHDIESVICTIDKDLNMIPGWHYHPGIKRKGDWLRPPKRFVVSPIDAIRFFYYQMLIGDTTDNIKGVVGIGAKKAEKLLDGLTDEHDMFNVVRDAYSCDEEMLMNGQCLWIWREMNGTWKFPFEE